MGKIVLGILLCLPFLGWGGARIVNNITYGRDCEGHIKRAADANTIEIATVEMETVVTYLERHNMTSGYTSLLWTTPDNDVGFWYNNLKSSLNELKTIPANAAALEKSNVLMKLRETLMDGDKHITQPAGIEIAPNNVAYAIWGWVGLFLLIFGVIIGFVGFADR